MVSLHFLSLMEALMECNSNVLARVSCTIGQSVNLTNFHSHQQLMPMWTPVFRSYQGQLAGHLQVRLQACVNWQPPARVRERPRPMNGGASAGGQQASGMGHGHRTVSSPMLRWLQKVQFIMTQIETQSSAATQFYTM